MARLIKCSNAVGNRPKARVRAANSRPECSKSVPKYSKTFPSSFKCVPNRIWRYNACMKVSEKLVFDASITRNDIDAGTSSVSIPSSDSLFGLPFVAHSSSQEKTLQFSIAHLRSCFTTACFVLSSALLVFSQLFGCAVVAPSLFSQLFCCAVIAPSLFSQLLCRLVGWLAGWLPG